MAPPRSLGTQLLLLLVARPQLLLLMVARPQLLLLLLVARPLRDIVAS
jgi:hypothetical protein